MVLQVQKFFFFLSFLVTVNLFSQNKQVPNFKLESISGEKVSLYEQLNKGPVYLNFWAMWCVPCRAELKALQSIYETYKDRGISIITINIDSPRSSSKVKSFISGQKYTFPVLLDLNQEVFKKFNGTNLPYSLLIDRKGKIIKIRNSYLPNDERDIIKDIESVLE